MLWNASRLCSKKKWRWYTGGNWTLHSSKQLWKVLRKARKESRAEAAASYTWFIKTLGEPLTVVWNLTLSIFYVFSHSANPRAKNMQCVILFFWMQSEGEISKLITLSGLIWISNNPVAEYKSVQDGGTWLVCGCAERNQFRLWQGAFQFAVIQFDRKNNKKKRLLLLKTNVTDSLLAYLPMQLTDKKTYTVRKTVTPHNLKTHEFHSAGWVRRPLTTQVSVGFHLSVWNLS